MTGESYKLKGEIAAALLAAAIVVFPVPAPAALPVLDFQKIITGLPRPPMYPVRMVQGPDNAIYISGNDWVYETDAYSGLLIKLDSAGNLLWYKNVPPFGGFDWVNGLAVDASGGAYVPVTDLENNRVFIVKYDADGNMIKSVAMPNAGAEYAPVAGGVAFDQSRGKLYASQGYWDPVASQWMARVEAYNGDLKLQAAKVAELGNYGDYNVNVSLDTNAAVYFGGVYGDGTGGRLYKAIKYTPGLTDEVWSVNAPLGAYDGRFFFPMSLAAPNGGLAFWSISQSGSALRRVSVDGVFAPAVDIVGGDYDTLALDAQGGAYVQSWAPDYSLTGLVKISAAGEYAWGSSMLMEQPDNYLLQAMIGEGDKIYTFGEFSTETEYGLYLARYTQGGGRDTIAPAAVANLAVNDVSAGSITLSWTAPGDDGTAGTAATYDLRYATSGAIVSDADFGAATQAQGEPGPQTAGSAETFTLTGLAPGTSYFFSLKIADEAGNISGISNCVSTETCVEVTGVPDWKQFNDNTSENTWWDDIYDHTSNKISKSGCALTAVSEVITKRGFNKNPGELNTLLNTTSGGFTGGFVDFEVVGRLSNLEYIVTVDSSLDKLSAQLKNGNPAVLKLWSLNKRKNGTRPDHFVVAVGKCGDTIYINDPGHSSIYTGKPTLSQYFNKLPSGLRNIIEIRYYKSGAE